MTVVANEMKRGGGKRSVKVREAGKVMGRGRGGRKTLTTQASAKRLRLRESKTAAELKKRGNPRAPRRRMEGASETGRLRRKKRGGVGPGKGRRGKRGSGATGKRGHGCGRRARRPLQSPIRGKTSAGTRAGAARYLQRSSRTLPGISTRLVSMMRTHSRSSASRLRAAGDRGYGTETPARRRAGGGSNEDERGQGRDPRTCVPHPQPWTPEAGPRRGAEPRDLTPLFCLNSPMGSWRIGSLGTLGQ